MVEKKWFDEKVSLGPNCPGVGVDRTKNGKGAGLGDTKACGRNGCCPRDGEWGSKGTMYPFPGSQGLQLVEQGRCRPKGPDPQLTKTAISDMLLVHARRCLGGPIERTPGIGGWGDGGPAVAQEGMDGRRGRLIGAEDRPSAQRGLCVIFPQGWPAAAVPQHEPHSHRAPACVPDAR